MHIYGIIFLLQKLFCFVNNPDSNADKKIRNWKLFFRILFVEEMWYKKLNRTKDFLFWKKINFKMETLSFIHNPNVINGGTTSTTNP
jgi:hypothetical protein